LAVGVFGSGDCPATPSVWRYAEVDAELRAWNYQKSQSPLLAMENDAQLRFGAIFEMRFPRRQKLGIFGVLIDQSASGPRPHAAFGLSWQDDDHGDCGLCQRQARNFVSIFGLRKNRKAVLGQSPLPEHQPPSVPFLANCQSPSHDGDCGLW